MVRDRNLEQRSEAGAGPPPARPSPARLGALIGGCGLAGMAAFAAYAEHHPSGGVSVWSILLCTSMLSGLAGLAGSIAELVRPGRRWGWLIASVGVVLLSLLALRPLLG